MGSLEILKLELLRLELLGAHARSQEAHRARLRSIEDHARARITCGIVRLVLLAGLFAVSVFVLWRL